MRQQKKHFRRSLKAKVISPLGTLLVEHTVTTVLAADRISLLHGNTGRALAAQVDNGGRVDGHSAVSGIVAEGILVSGDGGGNLVGFARHFGWFVGLRR